MCDINIECNFDVFLHETYINYYTESSTLTIYKKNTSSTFSSHSQHHHYPAAFPLSCIHISIGHTHTCTCTLLPRAAKENAERKTQRTR